MLIRVLMPFTALVVLSCGEVLTVSTDGATNDGPVAIDGSVAIDAVATDAATATTCETASVGAPVVFVNRLAGTYTKASIDSPMNNESTIPSNQTSALTAWDVPQSNFDAMQLCLAEVLAPFNVIVTDVEPNMEPYHEIVITSSSSSEIGFPNTLSLGKLGCSEPANNAVSFVFAVNDNPLTVCQSAASMVGFSQGLSRVVENCEDTMTFTYGCTLQVEFGNGSQTCGNSAPMPCSCTQQSTQNSFQQLLSTFGACPL